MISFKGKPPILKSAEILERNAKNIYPHISTSRIKTHLNTKAPNPRFYKNMTQELKNIRQMIRESGDFYSTLVYALQDAKIGNGTEDAVFAQLLGKINGQKNIYAGGIYINNGEDDSKILDHAVAFITDYTIKNKKEYFFKNKEAIIIDPWLGITDYAGSYFDKIKTLFRKTFRALSNNNFGLVLAQSETSNPSEYRQYMRKFSQRTHFSIVPFVDSMLKNESANELKQIFPELTIKNFNPIIMPKPKTKKGEKCIVKFCNKNS